MKYWNGPEGVYYNDCLNEILLFEYDCELINIKTKKKSGNLYFITRANENGTYPKKITKCTMSYTQGSSLLYLGDL